MQNFSDHLPMSNVKPEVLSQTGNTIRLLSFISFSSVYFKLPHVYSNQSGELWSWQLGLAPLNIKWTTFFFHGVNAVINRMFFQGADNQGDWHWTSIFSKTDLYFKKNSGFLLVWGFLVCLEFFLKGHINHRLQYCLTGTTKPAPMAHKRPH